MKRQELIALSIAGLLVLGGGVGLATHYTSAETSDDAEVLEIQDAMPAETEETSSSTEESGNAEEEIDAHAEDEESHGHGSTNLQDAHAAPDLTIDLTGRNFAYEPSEIRANQGDVIRVILSSTDDFHDFVIDGLDVHSEHVTEGKSTEITFLAEEAGTFEFYCSIKGHRAQGMHGTLIVQ